MKGFLEQVAVFLHHVYGENLHRFCIVFPNVRAGLFFRKYLAQLMDKPVSEPTFRSIESLFEEITGLNQANSLSMIFDLFQAYRQHKQTDENFEDFYFWGEILLDDFDDVDKHLVNARDLFCNISDLKDIDQLFDYLTDEQKDAIRVFWQDFNGGNSGSLKTDFASIWSLLYPIYESFKQRLKAKSLGYAGMIQREAVQLLRCSNVAHPLFEKYVFIGFNALTPCETFFFKHLQKQNRAIFFWDYDDYYLTNEWHEAGIFMRDNLRQFPSPLYFDTHNLAKLETRTAQPSPKANPKPETQNPNGAALNEVKPETSKHLEIISVPSDTGQARLAGQLLERRASPEDQEPPDWSRTAIVLPDEHLLLPMLSSLPEAIRDINITMGYPFTYSPAYSLFERLVALQQHARLYADGLRFYHHDVCQILYHPYIRELMPEKANAIVKSIIEHNRIYVPVTEISGDELLQIIFRRCTQAREFSEYLITIINLSPALPQRRVESSIPLGDRDGGRDCLNTALQQILDVLTADNIDMDVQVFCRLLRKVFASLKIPFSGEPLKGLQVMGMLETRALDFDRVIILSMNEGIFPKASPKQSFIPYNLRKGFGLSTSERHDAVSAYHFYRLIQRASDVHLIYNSAATDRNTGEMSRFLTQLIYEPVFNVQRRNITFRVKIDRNIPIVKERTDEVCRILNMYLTETGEIRRLSPSALNSYLDCRLKFYFRYVDGLKETEQVTDEIDPSVFGKLLHKTMELIYRPYRNSEVTSTFIEQLQKDGQGIQQALLRAFAEDYFHTDQVTDNDITGRNIIIREVLLKYIIRILEVDKAAAPFTILGLEESLDVCIPVCSGARTVHLNMHGYIDRMDTTRNTLRIIDYKTGNTQRKFTAITDLFDRSKTGNHAALQTLVYACMTDLARKGHPHITPGLYIMKDLFKENFDPRLYMTYHKQTIDNYFDVSNEFETELNTLLSEMFLSETPFTQTDTPNKCLNCLYADICHRKNTHSW